jgi:hypothetical protein
VSTSDTPTRLSSTAGGVTVDIDIAHEKLEARTRVERTYELVGVAAFDAPQQ